MSYLRFRKLLQSDNEGTFWPGYIEIPEDIKPKSEKIQELEIKENSTKNPRIYTGLALLVVVSLDALELMLLGVQLFLLPLASKFHW
jgi:hypothetical protein